MRQVSEDMVRAVFARAVEPMVILIEIVADSLDEPICVCSDPDGLISGGIQYVHFPFKFSWGGSGAEEISKAARLEIANVDGQIAKAVRDATGQPYANVMLVRKSAPDAVEIALQGALLSSIEVDDPKVTATLRSIDFSEEPACKARQVAARIPALF